MNFTHTQIRRYLSVPLTLTLLSLTAITPLNTLAETALNRRHGYNTERFARTGNQKHFDGNTLITVWYESNNWSIDRRYQIESEIELEEPIDWNNIEVDIDRDFSLVPSPEI